MFDLTAYENSRDAAHAARQTRIAKAGQAVALRVDSDGRPTSPTSPASTAPPALVPDETRTSKAQRLLDLAAALNTSTPNA